MAKVEKKTRKTKTTRQTQPKIDFSEVVEVLKRIDAKLDLIYGSKPSTILAPPQVGKDEIIGEETKPNVLINQSGETVELTYEVVKAEAEKLVKIDEFTEKRGFAKAREIIMGYGVSRFEDVPKENYPAIIEQFRKAVSEWK